MTGIQVKNLFGRFDYKISLAEGGMTILTGPNGFGKSTILKCISAASNSNLGYFFSLDFERIEILLSENSSLLIEKEEEGLRVNGQTINRQEFELWKRGRRIVTYHDHLANSPQYRAWEVDALEKVSQVIYLMKDSIGDVFSIEEQRLLKEAEYDSVRNREARRGIEARVIQVVENIPEKLRQEINNVASEYSRVANQLDSTFPQRLFNEKNGISKDEFDEKLDVMQKKVEKLNKYSISKIGKLEDIQFKEEDARALKVYFEDFEEKYRRYESLIDKLEMFTDMVNAKLLFKKVHIFEERLQVLDDDSQKEIALSQLSSGEKETVVLFYQLLFEVPDDIILLIDEPEISLHIAWQRRFAKDLQRIVKKKNLTAIVATHSPQFINGNRRIQIDLGELYTNGLN